MDILQINVRINDRNHIFSSELLCLSMYIEVTHAVLYIEMPPWLIIQNGMLPIQVRVVQFTNWCKQSYSDIIGVQFRHAMFLQGWSNTPENFKYSSPLSDFNCFLFIALIWINLPVFHVDSFPGNSHWWVCFNLPFCPLEHALICEILPLMMQGFVFTWGQ